jgi:membrane-associated phospholipid phosphatase
VAVTRKNLQCLAILVGLGLALPLPGRAQELPADVTPVQVTSASWWQTRDLVDYGIVAGSLGAFLAVHSLTPLEGGIGPRFDPAHPTEILAAKYANVLGRHHLTEGTGETVPTLWVGLAIPVVGLWLGLQEGVPGEASAQKSRHLHDTLVGLGEDVALTLLTTEVLKFSFGRLRPDFQDRVQRYYCNLPDHQGLTCTGSEVPLDPDPAKATKIFDDGRRSFPSGHSSTSFALATYASLVTGGHFVWGEGARDGSRIGGIALQVAALGTATFVAWSRVHDGRHNVSDVLTGTGIGVAIANLAYWRRFDTHGRSRRTPTGPLAFEVGPGPTAAGVSLTWRD